MNILVAFQSTQNAGNIRSILIRSGHPVVGTYSTGASALLKAHELGSGLLISGHKFPDMVYSEILSDLPEDFEMLLVAPPGIREERSEADLFCLSTPLQVHELLETVEMLSGRLSKRRKQKRSVPRMRSEAEERVIREAKQVLYLRNGMSEEEAHRYMQKTSMNNGTSLVETAEMIISLF